MSLLGMQGGSAPMYGLKLPARCLSAVGGSAAASSESPAASTSSHVFLVGTCSASEENELQVIDFDEAAHDIKTTAVYAHKQEIWHLSACPHDASICATTYALDSTNWQSTLWRLPSLASGSAAAEADLTSPARSAPSANANAHALQRLVDLTGHVGRVRGVVWNPLENERCVVSLDSQCMRVWELNDACTELQTPTASLSASMPGGPNAAAWDPHHARQLASCDGRNLKVWDLRVGSESTTRLDFVHEDTILDVDYNPNKPFHMLSTGADRRTHLWDLRSTAAPLKTLQGHSHWVWSAKFNRFHDQLLLTAGTERVNMWNILSLSSAPVGELEAAANGLIKSYSDHEDSVYSAAWSSFDAWIFATLSYDGRIVINHVPPAEKYKILL